jgi:hypothetical protein
VKPGRILLTVGATLGALYAAGLFYEIDFAPAGCCGLAWPSHDPAAAERQALARDPKGLNPAVQHDAAVAVLTARPAEPVAWIRLAYADALGHGGLTPAGAQAVDISYLVQPYAGPQAYVRIALDLDSWSRLTPQGRKSALAEIKIATQDRTTYTSEAAHASLAEIGRRAADPSGRMVAALMGLN